MPEGPSLVIMSEELQPYVGKKVLAVTGNAKIDQQRMVNMKITGIKSWGKHCLIGFKNFYLRIHLLMYGSYRISERRELMPRLSFVFRNGEINFYNGSIKLIEGQIEQDYDWRTDVMSDQWDSAMALKALKEKPEEKVCDVLLDQDIFSGSGNIIKNEVLFNVRIHPESKVGALSPYKLKQLVNAVPEYSHEFYHWKKAYVLRQHWQIYRKKECPRCKIRSSFSYCGKRNRQTYFCPNCQILYK